MNRKASRLVAAGVLLCTALWLVLCTTLWLVPRAEAQDFRQHSRRSAQVGKRLLQRMDTGRQASTEQLQRQFDLPPPPHKEPILFTAIKWAIIGLAAVGFAVVISYRLFSPNGWFNLKSKAEYVPMRYKPQHKRFLKELSKAAKQDALPLGIRAEGMLKKLCPTKLALPAEVRDDNPHMLVIGGGGKGKTRLLLNMIRHDIAKHDHAVIVVDSEGGLVDMLAKELLRDEEKPELRKRLLLIDPARRSGQAVSYDPLACDDQDPQIVANNIVLGFKAIYAETPGRQQQDQWNAQTANILRNSVMLLMANGRSLADLPTLLSENDFRDILLQTLEQNMQAQPDAYRTVLEAWAQYRRLARTDQWISWVEPILNRVQPVLADARVRAALTNRDTTINILNVIRKKKIVLVRIPQGHFDPSANLLGSLLITGLRQASIALASEEMDGPESCSLYVDEMDKFVDGETFGCISTEHRRYGIGMTGTLRTMQNIPEIYRHHILANTGTICSFAIARKDAELLGPQIFRVDGNKPKHRPIQAFFNPIGTSPPFEQVVDEEKLNVDRLIGLDKQEFFCYRVGTPADVCKIRSHKTSAPEVKRTVEKESEKKDIREDGRDRKRPQYRSKALAIGPVSEL